MARAAEKFYVSLGFDPMPKRFWEYSIFEKPADRDNIDCSDISYRFFNGKDYRYWKYYKVFFSLSGIVLKSKTTVILSQAKGHEWFVLYMNTLTSNQIK